MPVSGLVVSLSDDPTERAEALELLRGEARITVGVSEANRLAIVLDTVSSEEDKRMWSWLGALPGVTFVEVAFVGFEQPMDTPPTQSPPTPSPPGRSNDANAR